MKNTLRFAVILIMVSALSVSGYCTELDDILGGFESSETDTASMDDVLDGFGTADIDIYITERAKPKIIDLSGYFKQSASFNVNHHTPVSDTEDRYGLSKLRSELQLEADMTLPEKWKFYISGKGMYDAAYQLNGRSSYTDDVLESYESEFELRDAYIQGSITDRLDIKAGRQIVPWGKSDNIRITDILNPMDMREPGLTDIEDLRIPLTMTKLDYYTGDWNISGIVVHEIRFNKMPEYGHDFYPSFIQMPGDDEPLDTPENYEYAIALNGVFSGWDLSFYLADIYHDTGYKTITLPASLEHSRVRMIGTAAAIVKGNFLLKIEAAHFSGLNYCSTGEKDFERTDGLVGFDYNGFKDTTITFELADRYIHGFDESLKDEPDVLFENDMQSAFRITRKLLHEKLELTFLMLTYGTSGENGAMQRVTAEYEFTDSVLLTAGFVQYSNGDQRLYQNIEKNDRIFSELKYSF